MTDRHIKAQASGTSRDVLRLGQGNHWAWLVMAVVIVAAIGQLRFQGRSWWCTCGQLRLWSGDVLSLHNSQHLFDPYSLTHILHGVLLCGLLTWACPRLPLAWRLFFAVGLECAWEIFENSAFVIHRYRMLTIGLGYQGDTIVNSLGDILSCAIGFMLARRLGLWGSLGLFFGIEALLLIWIGDSLLLNVVMLVGAR